VTDHDDIKARQDPDAAIEHIEPATSEEQSHG
jgi:hypothetical protein